MSERIDLFKVTKVELVYLTEEMEDWAEVTNADLSHDIYGISNFTELNSK